MKRFKFLIIIFLFSFFSFIFSAVALQALPPILQILEKEPATLEDIEKLIDFRWYEKAWEALQAYPPDDEEVLFLKALSLMGLKKYEESLNLFISLPGNRSLLKQATILTRLKRYSEALQIYQEIKGEDRRAFKTALEAKDYERGYHLIKKHSGPEFWWWKGWCHFRLGRLEKALQSWNLITPKRGRNFYPQSLYWKAIVYEKLAQPKKSKALLEELIQKYPLNYYGFLGRFQLNGMQETKIPEIPLEEGEQRLKWEERYPRFYRSAIEREAKKRKIDPYLVFALIWQESRFNEEAISPVGAIGLMQLMPQTALQLANASKDKHFKLTDILDPPINIRLGIFYLKFLQKLFRGETPYTLAAYNSGEEAVSRWLSLRETEQTSIFVEEIPYNETQNYVRKVLTAFWIYQILYEGKIWGKSLQ